MRVVRRRIDEKLGRCPRCFSLALAGALLGWLFIGALAVLEPPPAVFAVAFVWPLSFTALWLAHLTVHAARTLAQARRRAREPVGVPLGALNRRDALRLAGRSVRHAAALSFAGVIATTCEDPGPTPIDQNGQQQPISCPCRRPTNVYNSSFWLGNKHYAAGCYDKCYSSDCRTYNSC